MNFQVTAHRWRVGHSVAALLAVMLLTLGCDAVPARAATLDGMLAFDGFHVGAFHSSDGTLAYCLEPAANAPFSTQESPVTVTTLPAYSIYVNDGWGFSGQVSTDAASGEVMRHMNWLLNERAQGATPEQAVAIQVALWELRRGSGNASWIDGKYALIRANGGSAYVDAGLELAAQARTEADGPGHTTPNGALELHAGIPHGAGTLNYPSGTTSLHIQGGTFADGSDTLQVNDGAAGTTEWRAALHDLEWNRFHEVRVTGTWSLAEHYWPDQLIMHPASDETEQRLGSGISPVAGTSSGEFAAAALTIDSQFMPAVVTAVPELVVDRDSGTFADTITVTASTAAAPWPQRAADAAYLPLTAAGTLYGPYNVPQEERDTVPSGAPVAAVSSLVLDHGPGSYSTSTAVAPLESGYYYWVWKIREDEQPVSVRTSRLLPEGGVFADGFGVQAEGQIISTQLRWVTELRDRSLTPEHLVLEDRIKIGLHNGAWLFDATGKRVPANIRFTVYQTDSQPVRQTEPAPEAQKVGEVFAEVAEAGVWIDAPSIELPAATRGWVTVRACLLESDQEESVRGYVEEWCDDFGVPEETAEIILPESPRVQRQLAETGGGEVAHAVQAGVGMLGAGVLILVAPGLVRRARRTRIQWSPNSEK